VCVCETTSRSIQPPTCSSPRVFSTVCQSLEAGLYQPTKLCFSESTHLTSNTSLMEKADDDDKSRSPSSQLRALSSSPPPSDNSQGVTGANPLAPFDQPFRSRGRRPANNPAIAAPATTSTTRPRTTRDRDTSELDTAPKTQSRDGQVSPNIGVLVLVILNSSLPLAASYCS